MDDVLPRPPSTSSSRLSQTALPWHTNQTASDNLVGPLEAQINHPFHPQSGCRIQVIKVQHFKTGEALVFYRTDKKLVTMPLAWTDLDSPDPFITLSAGRSPFRLTDLVQLAKLVKEVGQAHENV